MPDNPTFVYGCFGTTELDILEQAAEDVWSSLKAQKRGWAFSHEDAARSVIAAATGGKFDRAALAAISLQRMRGANDQ